MDKRQEAEQRLAEELGLSPNTIRVIKDERFDGFDTVVMRKLWNKLLAREMEREIQDARDWELLAEYAASKKKAGMLRAAEIVRANPSSSHEVLARIIESEAAKIEGE